MDSGIYKRHHASMHHSGNKMLLICYNNGVIELAMKIAYTTKLLHIFGFSKFAKFIEISIDCMKCWNQSELNKTHLTFRKQNNIV